MSRRKRRSGKNAVTAATAAALTLGGVGGAFATPTPSATPLRAGAEVSRLRCPGPAGPSSDPRGLVALGDTLFFSAGDGIHGQELWRSDGTSAGTTLVRNIRPDGADRGRGSWPQRLTVVGDTLFFTADDGAHGREVWKSDGTRSGTVLVKDISPNIYSDDPYYLTAVGDRLFFSVSDGVHGQELWASDGSSVGTTMVKDINGDPSNSWPSGLTAVRDRMLFSADDGMRGRELWTSDGTSAGTVLVKDINPNPDPYDSSYPRQLTRVRDRVFFNADDGSHGQELWVSDGTRPGTVLVKNIRPPGRRHDQGSGPTVMAAVRGRLFFAADDGTHGLELWESDGTRTGTVLVKDIHPKDNGAYGSDIGGTTALGRRVFFSADDGPHGQELWRSNGSRAGTVLVRDIDATAGGLYDGGSPDELTRVGDRLFFSAHDDTHGRELWLTDGSRVGTRLVKNIDRCETGRYPGSRPSYLTAVGDRLFFAAKDARHGRELWASDGTRAGTALVKDIRPKRTP